MTAAAALPPAAIATTRIRDRRRTSLVLAAGELFAHRGYEECTTSDIALHAGVSQRTFFRYFSSKEEVLLQWLDSYNVRICRRLEQRPPAEAEIEALRRALDHYCCMGKEERDYALLVNRLALASSTLQGRLLYKMAEWEERIALVLSERAGRDPANDPRAKLLAGFAVSILNTAFREAHKDAADTPVSVLIDHGFSLLDCPAS